MFSGKGKVFLTQRLQSRSMTYHRASIWAYREELIGLFHQFLNSTASLIPVSIRNKLIQFKVQFSFKSQVISTFIHNSCRKTVTRWNRNVMTAPYTFWLFSKFTQTISTHQKIIFWFYIVVKMFHWFWNASDISHYEIHRQSSSSLSVKHLPSFLQAVYSVPTPLTF